MSSSGQNPEPSPPATPHSDHGSDQSPNRETTSGSATLAAPRKPLTFGSNLDKFKFGSATDFNSVPTPLSTPLLRHRSLRNSHKIEKPNPISAKSTKILNSITKYSHLKPLRPLLGPNLRCIFIGFNPGIRTAETGHYYAHPTNRFWPLLSASGCVGNSVLTPYDDHRLPTEFQLGLTDLVQRPTNGISELSNAELLQSVADLESRIADSNPKSVCFVGKGIWDTILKAKLSPQERRASQSAFQYGWQSNTPLTPHTPHFANNLLQIYVVPSTSGLVTSVKRDEMLKLWKNLGFYIQNEVKYT